MNPRPATFGPQWGRIVLLFVGAFVTAGLPVGIAVASGVRVSGDEVWVLLAGVALYSALWMYASVTASARDPTGSRDSTGQPGMAARRTSAMTKGNMNARIIRQQL